MLPTPNLDDRTFQSLVDDARSFVHRRCPEWSEHNISDPGITLIETVAMMVDQLIYRLNRVPERNYIKFLDCSASNCAPGAAQGEVTFWLSAPQLQTITVREKPRSAPTAPMWTNRSCSRPPNSSTSSHARSNPAAW